MQKGLGSGHRMQRLLLSSSQTFCAHSAAAPQLIYANCVGLYPTELAVVYRHFPVHDAAIPAAVAAECAARAGAFESMHDALFDNGALIVAGAWSEFAAKAGIADSVAFDECLHSKSAAQVVKRDMDLGSQLGVTGTPTLFVNDVRFERNPGWEKMAEHINQVLGRDPRQSQR